MVREIRAAIGDERMLRVDANGRFTVSTALEVWTRIKRYRVRNFEDPVDTFEEMRRLRPLIPCAFSTHNPDLRRAVTLGVPDNFVCNIVELGGIRRTVEFVRACELAGIGFWFHSHEAAVASTVYLHLSAALEPIREPSQTLFRWLADDVISELYVPRGGFVTVPTGPGIGIELDRDALEPLPPPVPPGGTLPVRARWLALRIGISQDLTLWRSSPGCEERLAQVVHEHVNTETHALRRRQLAVHRRQAIRQRYPL